MIKISSDIENICGELYLYAVLSGANFLLKANVSANFIVSMDFNKIVCENFFDFSRELNQSDDIIQSIYNLIQRMRSKYEGLFHGLEKRLIRASHKCSDADHFIHLAKTSFRNQKIRNNQRDKYLALLFFTGEWINDQARLYVQDFKLTAVTDQIIQSMTIILTKELNFKMRSDWYDFVALECKFGAEDEESPENFIHLLLMGLSVATIYSLLK